MNAARDIPRWRLGIAVWIATILVMATNITREHYPAFSLVDGTAWRCDRYEGFHSDIFRHTDGHFYINNNIGTSALAAIPLWIMAPILDRIEAGSKAQLAKSGGTVDTTYTTPFPNRERMYRLARENGLDLRFGAATLVLSLFLLGPLAAIVAVAIATSLRARGVRADMATWLGFAGIAATPFLFRGATLNHNLFVAYATWGVWLALESPAGALRVSNRAVVTAGLFSGFALACDYSGAMTALWAGLIILSAHGVAFSARLKAATVLVLAAIPTFAIQLHAQWISFGNAWLPPARWMTDANFTNLGWRGFDFPALDLFLQNLVDLRFGLLPFAPLLILGFLPPRQGSFVSVASWRRGVLLVVLYLVFASSNQYARMQWNTGFRYLMPVIIPLWITTCAHLTAWPRRISFSLLTIAIAHTLVLTTSRLFNVPDDWSRALNGNYKLPLFDTLSRTASGREIARTLANWLPGSPEASTVQRFMEGPVPSVVATLLGIAIIVWLLRPNSRSAPLSTTNPTPPVR